MNDCQKQPDMYDYILETKDVIRTIINNRGDILKKGLNYFLAHDIEQIYMIGSGTSYHAAYAVKRFMEKILRMPVRVSYPMIFKDVEEIFNKKTLIIGSSHAGLSSSTIAGLDKAREGGLKTIASTAVHNSEIINHADEIIYCELGEEDAGPKTKGYFCAAVTHILFALAVAVQKGTITGPEEQVYIDRIQQTTDNMSNIAEKANEWYKIQANELREARRIVIIGYENNIATYMEGTLKILEAVRYSVTGYEMEEFMHGIYHSIWDDSFMFYLGAKGQYYPRLLKLIKYFEDRTKHNFLFSADVTQQNGKNFIVPFVDDKDFSFLEYIVPLQVIARRLSADLGINCNIPSDPDFHRKMGSYRTCNFF
jgi:glucosamine 6-phosphate synthetase-like amidotransferase/phosphosugar isomerase protein